MDLWQADKLILFIAFFVPGFIAIKVHDLLFPRDRRDASNTVLEAVSYSCVNYALLSWLVYIDLHLNLVTTGPVWHALILFVVLLVSPVLLAFVYACARHSKLVRKFVPDPVPKPWDYVFRKREAYWVLVELADGRHIAGTYDTDSFASSYPAEEQLYIQQLWETDGRRFLRPVERSKGALVSGKNIQWIEFFQ